MNKTRTQLRDDINTFLDDSGNGLFSAAQKNLAINMAIRSSWPQIKKHTYTSFSLTEGSYHYRINTPLYAITTVTRADPEGPAQVWIATSATSQPIFREMRGSVVCRIDGYAWHLNFDPTVVDNHDGYQIRVHFDQMAPELGADADTNYHVPAAYILPRALFHLCSMKSLTAHHTDVQTFRQQKPDFYQEAEAVISKSIVLPLARTVKIRWE